MSGPTREEAIDHAIECAQLLGRTEARRERGDYTLDDSRFERAMNESIAKHRRAALAFAAGAQSGEDARDAAYYKWRLEEILPLFQEARDALPAIPLWSAKVRGLRLCLGDRMDAAGTRTRADFDAAMGAPDA